MKIGELARLGGVNPKTIRYYESIGLMPEPARRSSGYRDYDDQALERLTFVRTAQRLGITLDEVREILALRERGQAPCTYVREVLATQLETIHRRILELETLEAQLTELAAEAETLPEGGSENSACRLIEHVRRKALAVGPGA
jgi:DNA-binding transcriptional MerR regulator